MTFTTQYNSKSIYLVSAIVAVEQLEVSIAVTTNALGEDIINAFGSKEEIRILKEIYTMVGGN